MKILVVSQYFWPENFRVNDLCIELQNRGYDVSVLTGKPNYPSGKFMQGYSFFNKNEEIYRGIRVYRTSVIPRGKGGSINLILNYFSFALFACLRLFSIHEKFDAIIVYQLSPATVGFPGILAKFKSKAKLYFYIQDLWPESIVYAGGLNSRIVFNVVNSMMKLFYKKSTQVWVQSTGFIQFLQSKGIDKTKIKFLPNTVESCYKPEIAQENYQEYFPTGFNIVYAGNIGAAQDFDSILKSAKILNDKNIFVNWIFIGQGREKSILLKKINQLNLVKQFYFLGSFPTSDMPKFFACADVLLVSLKSSDTFSLTIPTKLQSYLACGKPIIGNIDGMAASIIRESNSGLCSLPGDYFKLASNVEVLYKLDVEERKQYGVNAYMYFQNNYERSYVYNKLEEYLEYND